MRNTITRTFIKNACTCTTFNNGALEESLVFIPVGYNDSESAERYIRRNNMTSGKLVEVSKIERVSELFGMDESKFIELAKPVNERDKTTRNAITKTVKTRVATLVYMTAGRTIEETEIAIPNIGKRELEAYIRNATPNGGKPIELTNAHDVEKLYAMSESDFIKNAKPMVDHFHYKY